MPFLSSSSDMQQEIICPTQYSELRFTPDSSSGTLNKVMADGGRRLVKASSGDSGFGGSAADLVALSNSNHSYEQSSPPSDPSSPRGSSPGMASSVGYSGGRPRPQRRSRTNFTPEQLGILEMSFRNCEYPDIGTREQLADDFGIPEARIQVSLVPVHAV